MSEDAPHTPLGADVTCPTCGAVQGWSDVCRRCRCQLSLLRRMADSARCEHQRCLRALRAGRVSAALRHARRLMRISPDPPAARLLAVCHLLLGNWPTAARLARGALSQGGAPPGSTDFS